MPATERLTHLELGQLADMATYIGSPHHTDIPKFGMVPAPRTGAQTIEETEANRIDNPDCSLCPRKWAGRLAEVIKLLREAIRNGQVSVDAVPGQLPRHVWARDPDTRELVYEARKLSHPPNGYKAYPLTRTQSNMIGITLP